MADVFDILQQPGKAPAVAPKDVFDVITEAQGNPYQQDPRVAEALKVPNSTFGDRLSEGYFNTAQGLNLLGHYITQKLGITTPEDSQKIRDNIAAMHGEVQDRRRQDSKDLSGVITGANDTRDPGFNWARLPGEIMPFMTAPVMRGLGALGEGAGNLTAKGVTAMLPQASKLAPYVVKPASTAANYATQGAVGSQILPTEAGVGGEGAARMTSAELGAALGGALGPAAVAAPAVAKAVAGKVGGVIDPLIAPTKNVVGPYLDKIIGGDYDKYKLLLNPPELVPGSRPTTAQLLANPQAVAAEKATLQSAAFKPQLEELSNQNNLARLQELQRIGGTEDDLANAIRTRDEVTAPMRDKLLTNGQPVPVADVLGSIDKQLGGSIATDPTVKKGLLDLKKQIIESAGESGSVRPDILDGIRQNARAYLEQNASNGVVASKQEAGLEPIRVAITDAVERANPGYRDYLAAYAEHSTPINTREQIQKLLADIVTKPSNSGGNPQLRLATLNAGINKVLKGQYGISDDARQSLQNIQKDLQTESVSNSIRTPGSDTKYNLEAPSSLARAIYGTNYEGGDLIPKWLKLGSMGSNNVTQELAKALLDPRYAAKIAKEIKPPVPAALAPTEPTMGALPAVTGDKLEPILNKFQLQDAQKRIRANRNK
jgi:hypothetical protein